MNKNLASKLFGLLSVIASAIAGAVTLGWKAAVGAGVAAAVTYLSGVFHDAPSETPKVPPLSVVALLATVVSLGSFGCWLTKPPPVSPTVPDGGFPDASAGQTFVDCSLSAVHATELQILPSIETALATADYAVELAKLVSQFGLAEVECGVQWVVDKASGMAAKTFDAVEEDKAQRGRLWLAAHPVTFK